MRLNFCVKDRTAPHLKRSLSLWPLVATILCCVSGGPFGLEPVAQGGAGLAILLVLVTPLIWSFPAAMMTAELAGMMPEEGGYYVWVRRAMGPFAGFLCGWWSWIYSWVDVATYPVLFVKYALGLIQLFGDNVPALQNPWVNWAAGLVVIVPLTLLNIRGTKLVGDSSVFFFILIVLPFVLLFALGLPAWIHHPSPSPFLAPGKTLSSAFSAGLFVVMWNYLGWDNLSTVAGEVRDASKSYPRALAISVPIVTAVYVLPLVIGLSVAPDVSKWDTGYWNDIAKMVGGPALGVGVAIAGLVSAAALFSATLLPASRVPFVLAEDKVLPSALTKIHPRYGTPWVAILVSSIFYTILSYASFSELVEVDVIVYSAGLALEFAALVILRLRSPDAPRPYRVPFGWIGLTFVVVAPMALIIAAIVNGLEGEHQRLLIEFTVGALASGPVVWWISRWVRPAT